ncbi:MAG: 30S ribosomal protein S1, partial [Anaerolineae bacterium]
SAQPSWEDQLEESLSGSTLKRGELREGTILYQRDDGFVVDIGAKRDGFVPIEDIEEIEEKEFEVGDEVPVVVTRFRDSDGNVELSISQALLQEDWLTAEKLLEDQTVYETVVTGSNRGGLTVEFGRLRGFVPMSQIIGFNRIRQPAERHRRLRSMVEEEIMLKVIEVNRRRRRLILSQRAAAKEWRSARRETLLEELEPGQVRRGRISQITDFGLFVNLGGMDGLVHISELSWGRIENPGEIYRPGQRVKVKVLNVDPERERIGLSIKALTPDPWESVAQRYDVGSLVEGHVTQVVDFGVFIELEPGVEGLLHNSELRDISQREELSSGQTILVKVIRVEPNRRRIGLSVRQVRPDEWEEWALTRIEEEAQEAEEEAEEATEAESVETEETEVDEAEEAIVETEEEDEVVAEADEEVAETTSEAEEAIIETEEEDEVVAEADEEVAETTSEAEEAIGETEEEDEVVAEADEEATETTSEAEAEQAEPAEPVSSETEE